MPAITTKLEVELSRCECSECACQYWVTAAFCKHRQDDHATFYCPNGHTQWFPGKSEAEKLRDQLTAERAKLDQAMAGTSHWMKQAELNAAKLAATERRVGKGVCPCCNRTFSDLKRHMAVKHPKQAGVSPKIAPKDRGKVAVDALASK
jgi:hypothetical protein